MSEELVKRLRDKTGDAAKDADEAADEIERLKRDAELQKAVTDLAYLPARHMAEKVEARDKTIARLEHALLTERGKTERADEVAQGLMLERDALRDLTLELRAYLDSAGDDESGAISEQIGAFLTANGIKQPCHSPYCECERGKCSHPGFYDARHEPLRRAALAPAAPKEQTP